MMTKSEENEQEFLLGGSSGNQKTSYNSITYVSKVAFYGYTVYAFCSIFACTQEPLEFSIPTSSTSRKTWTWVGG
jgi:hypothetical protein